MQNMKKKGMGLGDLMPVALAFVVVTIAASIGANVLSTSDNSYTANSEEANISKFGLTGLQTLSSWLPTIALVTAAAVVIGVLVANLARGQ